jgi:uncharacterized protein
MTNPFTYGERLAPDAFIDRADELALCRRRLREGKLLFMVGPRRHGKTALLTRLEELLPEDGVQPIRLNAEQFTSVHAFAEALFDLGVRVMVPRPAQAWAAVTEAAGTLRPQLSMRSDGVVTVTLGIDPRKREARAGSAVLARVLEGIDALAGRHDRRAAILIDEFQELVRLGDGERAEHQLRAAIQERRHTGYLLTGSHVSMMREMATQPGRPFYRAGDLVHVGTLPREEVLEALRGGFGLLHRRLAPEAAEHLLRVAGEVPFDVQQLAHRLWERVSGGVEEADPIDTAAVDAALDQLLREYHPVYVRLWKDRSRSEQQALLTLIETGGREVFAHDAARQIPKSTLQGALQRLLDAMLIYREPGGDGADVYRIAEPLFARWIETRIDTAT